MKTINWTAWVLVFWVFGPSLSKTETHSEPGNDFLAGFDSSVDHVGVKEGPELRQNSDIEVLHLDELMAVKLEPEMTIVLQVQDIPSSYSFLTTEFHVQRYNLTLSSTETPTAETSVTARSGGLLTKLPQGQDLAFWYLQSQLNQTVTAYVKVTPYSKDDPMPGGCNQEFLLPIDPNIYIKSRDPTVKVMYQFANVDTGRGGFEYDCEDSRLWESVTYDLYLYYLMENDLSEGHFHSSLERMTNIDAVPRHATWVQSVHRGKGQTHVDFVSYQGVGVMYTLIAKHTMKNKTTQALYITSTDYGCNFDGLVDNCFNLESSLLPITKVISIICAGLGLYITFFGHRFFKLQQCVFGFIAFMLLFYIILSVSPPLDHTVVILVASGIGLVGGALWVAFWWYFGIPVLSELLVSLVLGFLFSSIVFYTPFGLLGIWRSSFNYGMGFTCGILLIPVALLYFTKTLSIVACTVTGAYSVVFCIGLYLRCSIPYIMINAVMKAVIPGFLMAVVTAPFQIFDIILVIVWIVLVIVGMVFQYFREQNRPAFPHCPRTALEHNRELQMLAEESADRSLLLPADSTHYRPRRSFKNYGTYGRREDRRVNDIR